MDRKHPPNTLPTIPVPRPDFDSLCKTTVALKQVVEMVVGHEPGGSEYKPTMFMQAQPPIHMHDGDFWLSTGEQTVLSLAIGGQWKLVGTLV